MGLGFQDILLLGMGFRNVFYAAKIRSEVLNPSFRILAILSDTNYTKHENVTAIGTFSLTTKQRIADY